MGLLASPERIGLNEATTFYGFCDKHDSELFRPLESGTFGFTSEQIALLGYRAICRESYQKDAEIAAGDMLRDAMAVDPDVWNFRQKDRIHQLTRLGRLNARENLASARKLFTEMLNSDSRKALRYFAILFAEPPKYFCSTAFVPEWDFDGNVLQDLGQLEPFHPICFSAWAAEQRSAVVFCWHESADPVCIPFIESLRHMPNHRLGDRILSMAFEISENVVFREDWWENMRQEDQNKLAARVFSGLPSDPRTAASLLDDGLEALSNTVVSTYVGYA
jgi:hypothetical protein